MYDSVCVQHNRATKSTREGERPIIGGGPVSPSAADLICIESARLLAGRASRNGHGGGLVSPSFAELFDMSRFVT